jgi:hypothetical protein
LYNYQNFDVRILQRMMLTCPDDGGLAKDEGGGGDGDRSSARSQQHQSYNKPQIM